MMNVLRGAVIAGGLAFGGMLAGVAPAAAYCSDSGVLPCSTLSPMVGGTAAPGWGPPPVINNPGAYNPGVNYRPRHHRRAWRHHHYRPSLGWWGGGIYVDRYVPRYYDDDYYDRPAYRVQGLSAAHVDWCYKRYKTYRASDNTYKPTKYTRRQCISPYS